ELGKKGVVLNVDALLMPQSVASGGKDTGTEFWGNATYTLQVDSGKLGLWPGGFLKVQGETTFGNSLLEEVGSILGANVTWLWPKVNEPASALMGATLTQFLSHQFGIFAGKISTPDLQFSGWFAGDYRSQFLNPAINFPMALGLVPFSAFGGGVIVIPSESIHLSAMVIDPSGTATDNDVGNAFSDGILALAAGSLTIKPFGLVGRQNLSGVWSNKDRVSLNQDPSNTGRFLLTERFPRLGDPGPILLPILERFAPDLLIPVQPLNREDKTWAIIYGFEQYFWQPEGDPKRGLGVFFNFGVTDGDANPVKYSYNVGIGGNGVVPGRPNDKFGIAWARTQFSDNFVPVLRQTLDLGLDHEDAIEMYYNASIMPWVTLSLGLQVINSGLQKTLDSNNMLTDVDNTVVVGLRTYIRF
ncbi:MAG: carbohydrate porin, partial [Nitrospirae bacterium]|nr:carbohydrate porin [Nitrospirota bacterium]